MTPPFRAAPIQLLERQKGRLRMRLTCGHESFADAARLDLFDAFRDERPVHCWDCGWRPPRPREGD